jgi:spermidine dehydrogenase
MSCSIGLKSYRIRRVKLTWGEDRPIPRRDFLQGALIGAASALTGSLLRPPVTYAAASDLPGYYPPIRTGLRGSQPGSFEQAHALRDGGGLGAVTDTGEAYDLVVVGCGISGLAAAHFYRSRFGADRQVLLLDNHDDFGGHARRNEFHLGGGLQLINGGTLEIDSPRPYSAVSQGLLAELGIDVPALARKAEHRAFYEHAGLQRGSFLDRETFGADHLIAGLDDQAVAVDQASLAKTLARSPLSSVAQQHLVRVISGHVDYLPGLAGSEKKDRLSRISYRDFLRDLAKVDPAVLAFLQGYTYDEWGVGADAVSALDCWAVDYPGFKGMNLPPGAIQRMGPTPAGYKTTGGSAKLHFPDGNATIARLLVRALVPGAMPGASVADVVTARADYSQLDRQAAGARLRLNSTVLNVERVEGGKAVNVVYVRDGARYRVRARHCVLAGWNMMIPYLCPELPAAQQAAMHSLVKTPLVYTTVALRNSRAFHKLGVYRVYAPGCFHTSFGLNRIVDIGDYRSPRDPAQPTLIRMQRTPCQAGLSEYDQNRAGRAELLATPFAVFERNIREQLARILGPGGFDPARDIEGIMVNRWPHGYAPEYNPLFDPDVPPEQRAHVIARAPFGNITIANSDAGGEAYTDCAIDQAHRAVMELPA